MRIGNLKFFAGARLAHPRLYDVPVDPGETKNIWTKTKKRDKRLANQFRKRITWFRKQLAK
ncbi:MAG: hypothetical protein AB7I59_30590 [Geminicoccaceae bacterium]